MPSTTLIVSEKPPVEQWLDDRFVVYNYYAQRPLSDFNEKKSLENQARFQAIIPENVKLYAAAMKAGSTFPGIVAWDSGNGLIIVDGNHRFQAAKSIKRKTIPTYVIDSKTQDNTLQILLFEANVRLNGEASSLEERTRHGIWLIDNKATVAAAASVVGVSAQSLTRAYKGEEARRRADGLDIAKWWSKLPVDAQIRLNMIHSNPVFVAATKVVAEGKLNATEYRELVATIGNFRSESEQLDFVAEQFEALREAIQQRGAGVLVNRKGRSATQVLRMQLAYIKSLDPASIAATLITNEHRESLYRSVFAAMATLDTLLDAIGDVSAESESAPQPTV